MNRRRAFPIFAASVLLVLETALCSEPQTSAVGVQGSGDYARRVPASADYGHPGLTVTSLPNEAQTRIQKLHVGMTRAEIESLHGFAMDGGLYDPLAPRYFLIGMYVDRKGIMLDLSFQPAEMTDAIYQDEKLRRDWLRSHENYCGIGPHDVLRGIGRPYFRQPSID